MNCMDCMERPVQARGVCRRCYARRYRDGTLGVAEPAVPGCRWPGCAHPVNHDRTGRRQAYCRDHYRWNVSRIRLGLSYDEFERRNGDGDRRLLDSGYVQVRDGGRMRQEHTVVMERVLGRPLVRGESVHHINGVRHDNRPENLELWVGAIRYGQRASDIRCHHCGAPYMAQQEAE